MSLATLCGGVLVAVVSIVLFVTSNYESRPAAVGGVIGVWMMLTAALLLTSGHATGWWFVFPTVWMVLIPVFLLVWSNAWVLFGALVFSFWGAWRLRRRQEEAEEDVVYKTVNRSSEGGGSVP